MRLLSIPLVVFLVACRSLLMGAPPTATARPTLPPPPIPTAQPNTPAFVQSEAGANGHPTLEQFWDDTAAFVVDVPDTGLPVGESETVLMSNGELWSYVHASFRSPEVKDSCGSAAVFPGCAVIFRSTDGGKTFALAQSATCQFKCNQCPCDDKIDHTTQQQYPRIAVSNGIWYLAYEWQGGVMLRRSRDGLNWSDPTRLAFSGIWHLWFRDCPKYERIGDHPFAIKDHECLAGGPPGIFVEKDRVYVFIAQGQNPGSMGCVTGGINQPADTYTRCKANPLFTGAQGYGDIGVTGAQANPYFDFRTVSAAEVVKAGKRYYMLYEGIRGPGPADAGDNQFGLGIARTTTDKIDGKWEKRPNNPIFIDTPANIGVGHADVIVINGQTFLYTTLDGIHRARLKLVWKR